jgi:fumarate reductase subunit C
MQGWWRRDPFFVRYMIREATALAVLVYAVILAVGVWRLSQGEAAFNGWLAALRSPGSIALHLVLLAGMVIHAKSWFEIMPKTLPMILKPDGERLGARAITVGGWVATALASAALLVFALWAGSTP